MTRSDASKTNFFELLQSVQLEQVFLRPTETGLSKSIFDATKTITNYFHLKEFHDYHRQAQGPEAKVNLDCKIITDTETVVTAVSLYRPKTKNGDNRFWISGINRYCKPDDVMGLFVRGQTLWIANLSITRIDKIIQTLPSKEQTAKHFFSYEQVNYSIGKVIISGAFSDVPLYLDFDGVFSEEVSSYLGVPVERLSSLIFELVRTKLDLEKPNPYTTLSKENDAWWATGFSSPPPTLLFLCCLSLTADQMSSDGGHSLNNYYDRLLQLLRVEGDAAKSAIRNKFSTTEKYWKYFNTWLLKNDGKFGIVTAKPVIKQWKYVSIPISQALLRKGDKKNIKLFLTERRLDKESEIELTDLAEILNRWLTSTAPTKYLQNLWKNKDLRRFITDSAFELLAEIEPVPERLGRKKTLKFGIREITFPIKSLQPFLFCSEKLENDLEDVCRHRGSSVFGDIHFSKIDEEISILGPPQNLSLDNLLLSGIEVKTSDEKLFAYSPKKVIALKRLPSGYFVQINRPRIFEEYLIFGLDRGQIKQQAIKFLNFCAAQGYELLENPNGVPAGFFVIDKVTFTRSIGDSQWPYDDPNYFIRPSGSLTSVFISGAINLGRNIFHADSKPIFRFPLENQEPANVELIINLDSAENEITIELTPQLCETVAEFKIDLHENHGENCEVRVCSAAAQFVETRLSFRNANNPRMEKPPSIYYSFQVEKPSMFLGVKEGENDQQCAHFSSFSIKNMTTQLSPISNVYDTFHYKEPSSNPANYFDGEKVYEYSLKNNTLENAAESMSCILGQHYFKIPDNSSDGIWEAVCSKCGEERYFPTQEKIRKQNITKRLLVYSNDNLFAPTYLKEKNESYSVNTILDSVHYLQELSYQKFSEICRDVSDKPLFSFELLNSFSVLGEVEILIDERSFKPRRIFSAEPTLVKVLSGYVLRGFKNAELINELVEKIGPVSTDEYSFRHNPTETILFKVSDEIDSASLNVKDCFGRKVHISKGFGDFFVEQLPKFSKMYNNLPAISVAKHASLETFDPVLSEWVSANTMEDIGAYRVNWPYRQYFMTLVGGKTVSSTYELAKLYAGHIHQIRFQNYDEVQKSFVSNLGCDLPNIVQRALVSFTGQMPSIDESGKKVYRSVPKNFAQKLIDRIYS